MQPNIWSPSDNGADLPLPLSHNVLLLITINDVLEGSYRRQLQHISKIGDLCTVAENIKSNLKKIV